MNNYGGLGLPFWKDLGALVAAEDPYHRILGAHPTPPGWAGGAEAPQWSTAEVLHDEPWLDYNQSQTGHGRWRNEYDPPWSRRPMPEPAEAHRRHRALVRVRLDAPTAGTSASAPGRPSVRAAGHTYGGGHVWLAYVPEVTRPRRSSGVVAPRSQLRNQHPRLPRGTGDGPHGEDSAERRMVASRTPSGARSREPFKILPGHSRPDIPHVLALGRCGQTGLDGLSGGHLHAAVDRPGH